METIVSRSQRTIFQRWRQTLQKYIAVLQVSVASNLAYAGEVFFRALLLVVMVFILCSLAFLLGNTEGLSQQMLGALVSFSTYPIDIFHGAIRLLLFTLVPAGFISFIPLQLLHRFTWPLMGAMVGSTILIVAIAVGVFELGLRRYESGNLLGMQG